MRADLPIVHLARVCVETTTGLSITSGTSEGGFDTQLARDANGLPALPGTALAGVLRSVYQDLYDVDGHAPEQIDALFGQSTPSREHPSRVHVSWGAVHNSLDQPIEGVLTGEKGDQLQRDPVLSLLAQPQPVMRDHVALDHRGTAADQIKFDRVLVPAGCRFTLEVVLWQGDAHEAAEWPRLLQLFDSPRFRLGGATRRGLGAVKPMRIHAVSLDLRKADDFARYADLSMHLGEQRGLAPWPPQGNAKDGEQQARNREPNTATATITLSPEDFWRFGQGDHPLSKKAADQNGNTDQLPLTTPVITWRNNRAENRQHAEIRHHQLLIPASAIKGALAHRFAFHVNRLSEHFVVDPEQSPEGTEGTPLHYDARASSDPVRTLFGFLKSDGGDEDDAEKAGQAGHLLIDDATLPPPGNVSQQLKIMMHNSQDRFTGGVRNGILFSEELLFKMPFSFTLTVVDTQRIRTGDEEGIIPRALKATLADLCEGRLALGAGGSKGHGYFSGTINWDGDVAWVHGEGS